MLGDTTDDWCGRVTFAGVSDEVVLGDHGTAYLLRQHADLEGDALICGEGPEFRRLAVGEKGVLWLTVQACGPPGPSSAVPAALRPALVSLRPCHRRLEDRLQPPPTAQLARIPSSGSGATACSTAKNSSWTARQLTSSRE